MQRIGLIGGCGLVIVLPYLKALSGSGAVTYATTQDKICVILGPIPIPPTASEEQMRIVDYTNTYLAQLRDEVGCGR